jgi:hypothetical protein
VCGARKFRFELAGHVVLDFQERVEDLTLLSSDGEAGSDQLVQIAAASAVGLLLSEPLQRQLLGDRLPDPQRTLDDHPSMIPHANGSCANRDAAGSQFTPTAAGVGRGIWHADINSGWARVVNLAVTNADSRVYLRRVRGFWMFDGCTARVASEQRFVVVVALTDARSQGWRIIQNSACRIARNRWNDMTSM